MMILLDLLKAVLARQGVSYAEINDSVQFIMTCGAHKWNVAFTSDEESFLRYYARYPWKITDKNHDRVMTLLNQLNTELRAGCFMAADGYPVFRYGVYIFDSFTAEESVADLILTAAAKTNSAWDDIFAAAERGINSAD